MRIDHIYQYKKSKKDLSDFLKYLNVIGNPQKEYRTIIIAGSKGKSSTATILSHIIQSSGHKVGLFISPHLQKINERIQVNNKPISDKDFLNYVKQLNLSFKAQKNVGFFDYITAIAFMHFKDQKVDYAVLEVGMGGRLDSTNVAEAEISIITNIQLEHQNILGKTKLKIAKEKAGIIKENKILLTAETNPKMVNYFKKVCKEKNSRIFVINKFKKYPTNLKASYQLKNIALGVKAAKLLGIKEEVIRNTLMSIRLKGRYQKIKNFILDGAHTPKSIQEVLLNLKKEKKKYNIVIGLSKKKKVKEIMNILKKYKSILKDIVITKSSYKAMDPKKIQEVTKVKTKVLPLKKALNTKEPTLVTGSLYLVGDALNILGTKKRKVLKRSIMRK